jgi:hypothetical protein
MPSTSDLSRLYSIINDAEKNTGRRLTNAGRQMLVSPLGEILDLGFELDWEKVFQSILLVVGAAEPDTAIETKSGNYNARSIIAAFHKQFCNIPPFCGAIRSPKKL